MPVSGLKKWRLIQLLHRHDIDEQEVDWSLSQEEVEEQIRRLVGTTEQEMRQHVRMYASRADEIILGRIVDDVRQIITNERIVRKQAKYDVGTRILQDEEWLTRRYGDNYFGRLARAIDRKGYSADQLRKCVRFAELPEEVARSYIEDDTIGWEYIRRYVLREITFLPPLQAPWQGCPAVLHHLRQISQIHSSKERSLCRPCKFYKLCRKINREAERLTTAF